MGRLKLLAAAALLGGAAPLCAQGESAPAAPAALQPVVAAIDGHFRRFQQEEHVPGLVWGIVRGGRLAHLGTAGIQDLDQRRPVTADSLFRIASMSKAFTALAILKLRDEGRLSLDALAETYVPELARWRYPTADSPRIRIRDLLTHTAGFVTDNPWGDRQQPLPEAEFTRMLVQGVPFSRAPGTAYEYSNFGYALLGRIVSNVSGRPYADYIEQEIMRPLGMASTRYEVAQSPPERRALGYRWEDGRWTREPDMAHGAFGAMGGVETSAGDYARYVAWLLAAWPARDGAEQGPVRRASVRELAQGLNFPQSSRRPGASGESACRQAAAYGMGMRVAVDCELGITLAHGGGYPGYGSYLLLLPEHDVGIFAFANHTYSAPVPPAWDAAMELHRARLLGGRTIAVSDALAAAYRAVGAMYRAGDVAAAGELLAMNFLMDRSAENWGRDFAGLKLVIGECATDAPIVAASGLAGRFTWTCERGTLRGGVLLAPTAPAGIQELHLEIAPLNP
ncbi:MAG TPA: serine hydrolase domain-containing protein [Allosphingosinicella sp.]|nr:serine hydrolase domain-containing protein [Allosphingosinicella sp.]